MIQFSDIYSQYYDLIYKDKQYKAEAEYINSLILEHKKDTKEILELGCGTGRYTELFCDFGYSVHGVDMSLEMLRIAEQRRIGREDRLRFTHSKIQDLDMDKKFDVIVALFHVMSYQTSNEDLIKAFQVARKHLVDGGLFIFDFWYGPAVLTNPPVVRVKRLENEKIKITRIAEPTIYPQYDIVDVNYDIFIEDKEENKIIEIKELHKMRYFFDTGLEMICNMVGFQIMNKFEWLTYKSPDLGSWYVVWETRKF